MEQLRNTCEQLRLTVNEEVFIKFFQYQEAILGWNEKVNLTAITDRKEFVKKHFVDSILCANLQAVQEAERVIDVGTGAGFPGVPLALLFPEKQFVLIDSLAKRIRILDEICRELKILNVSLVHGRAEDLAREKVYRESFDLCVSRAVANLAVLAEYCLPFVRKNGYFLPYKGPDGDAEILTANEAIRTLGGRVVEIFRVSAEGFDLDHSLILIQKTEKTPEKYPRKAGMPSKEPLK